MKPPKKFREEFIKWYEEKNETPDVELEFTKWTNSVGNMNKMDHVYRGNEFVKFIQQRINNENSVSLNVNMQWEPNQTLVGLGKDKFDTDLVRVDFKVGSHKVAFENLSIKELLIRGAPNSTILIENCRISRLQLGMGGGGNEVNLVMRKSWVGNLVLYPKSIQHFEMTGGGIFNLECPTPDAENPFTGSVIFARDVFLPRNTKHYLIKGPQPYRNLQAQLMKLENGPAVSFVRAAEQAIEREADTHFNKFLSYLYQWFSDFGSSALRPVLWLVALFVSNALLIYYIDGAVLKLQAELYAGWEKNLLDTSATGKASRAAFLALQSIVNPFGIFGARAMVVAETGLLNIWLGVSGLFSAVLIALLILALRRRFKMR